MRLINADALKESLGPIALLIAYRDDKGKIKRIKDVIDNQPTAYDAEKVVEQLQQLPHGEYKDEFGKGYSLAVNIGINLVKAGGIE